MLLLSRRRRPAPVGIQRQNGFLSLLPFISHASLSGYMGIPFPLPSTRTKCTCCRFRAGGFPPVRTGIRVRTCSTRTNRSAPRRLGAHAIRSAHTGIRVHACSIRNVCTWFPSFAPLSVVSRPDTMSTPPFTPILARRGKIFHHLPKIFPPLSRFPPFPGPQETPLPPRIHLPKMPQKP